jgi:Ran GTPase-activating protein (RanGAP) involved in mRNA processing and transport
LAQFLQVDIDELIHQCLKQLETSSEASLHEIITDHLCECTGALELCDLVKSKVFESYRFDVDGFCAAIAEALSSTIHYISTMDFSHNSLKTPTVRLIKECILSNPSITELNLSYTNLQREDATVIASIIASNSTLRKLDVSGNCFFNSGIAAIAKSLIKNYSITDFDISNTAEDSQYCDKSKPETLGNALCAMIKSNSSIQKLNLSYMVLSDNCIKFLADGFLINHTITDLDISGNYCQDAGITALSRLITSNGCIVKLRMSNVFDSDFESLVTENALSLAFGFNSAITDLEIDCEGFSSEGMRIFADSIASNTTIFKLNISETSAPGCHWIFDSLAQNCFLTDFTARIAGTCAESTLELATALSKMIKCNSSIVKLDLSQSNFSSNSIAISIAVALSHNSCIGELNLNECNINSAGGIALANMLSLNKTIRKLCLNSNNFDNEAVLAIAKCLSLNNTIKTVDVAPLPWRSIWIPNKPAVSVFADMLTSSSITSLNISNIGFDLESVVTIITAIQKNLSMTDINLQNCFNFDNFEDERTCSSITDLISSNSKILKLNLARNSLEDGVLVMIAKSLKINQSITDFDISGNGMGDKSAVAFLKAIDHNKNIKSIKLFESEDLEGQPDESILADSTINLFLDALLKYPQIVRPSTPYVYPD